MDVIENPPFVDPASARGLPFYELVGDEHTTGAVSDRELGFRFHQSRLWCHSARPEHGDFTGSDCDCVPEIGAHHIWDAYGVRIAKMYRSTVGQWIPGGQDHGLNRLRGCERPHAHDQRSRKWSRR